MAFLRNDDDTVVCTGSQRLEERPIKLGLETATKYEVLAGLNEGDRVVIGNSAQLRAGQQVEAKLAELLPGRAHMGRPLLCQSQVASQQHISWLLSEVWSKERILRPIRHHSASLEALLSIPVAFSPRQTDNETVNIHPSQHVLLHTFLRRPSSG